MNGSEIRRTWPQSVPFYYGWINVVIAAIAMTATLPSRTHGLGLITEPLLADLQMSKMMFTSINFFSCVIGAVFSLPAGYLIDRYGVRVVLTGVSVCFGLSVLAMADTGGPTQQLLTVAIARVFQLSDAQIAESIVPASLFLTLTFIRGFGQCALSIVSIALVGKWFNRRMGLAMGIYTILMSIGFIFTTVGTGELVIALGWRPVWSGCGLFLLFILAPLGWLLVRSTPEACGLEGDEKLLPAAQATEVAIDYTYKQALSTPAFWVFACGTSMFNFVWSANTLLNESILAEQGFPKSVSPISMGLLVPGGLIANYLCGMYIKRSNLGVVLGGGLLLLSLNLTLFPHIHELWQLYLYSSFTGVIGGIVTVAHFAAWRALYGASHLGRIQGPAQLLSVLFSAAGPLFAAYCHTATKSYRLGFYSMSAMVGVLALAALAVPVPPERRAE